MSPDNKLIRYSRLLPSGARVPFADLIRPENVEILYEIAADRGLSRSEFEALTMKTFICLPVCLTVREADALMEYLKGQI